MTRQERALIVSALRELAKQQDVQLVADSYDRFASELENSTCIQIETPAAKRTTLREFQDRNPAPKQLRGSDSLSDPRD